MCVFYFFAGKVFIDANPASNSENDEEAKPAGIQ